MRVEDWPERLIQCIESHDRLFIWGESDCMQLVMDCAKAMTEVHPYPKAERSYKTKAGAASCLRKHGFENIVEALAQAYKEIPVSLAQRGDIGVVTLQDAPASVVCDGIFFVGKAPNNDGLIRVSRDLVSRAFRVE